MGRVITRANSKQSDKEYRWDRWNSYKGKGNKDFAIDKEAAFERIRLRVVYNEEIQDFDKLTKCAIAKCPYGTKDKERIMGELA